MNISSNKNHLVKGRVLQLGVIILLTALAMVGIGTGCQEPSTDGVPEIPQAQSDSMSSGPFAEMLNDEMARHYAELEGLSYDELLAMHEQPYLEELDFDAGTATHYEGFVATFGLPDEAVAKLNQHGFVVVPGPASYGELEESAGYADIYYRVFSGDLPVFISADSILHAWHRSFDDLLEATETKIMIPALRELLLKTLNDLDTDKKAEKDAVFYLSVAAALLGDSTRMGPDAVWDDVALYLGYVQSLSLQRVTFMGEYTWIDFSQFKPRGHYTHSEALERYFKAMMWLGRTDLVLYGEEPPRPREEKAARALAGAMATSGATAEFDRMNDIYAAYVGQTNAITPKQLLALCETQGLTGCDGDADNMTDAYAAQTPPAYSSRVFAGATPPIAMRFFPQRFGYGSWVTTKTTTPRLQPAVKGGRAMAMPEDVVFALGASRAATYFAEDMQKPYRENLPATLEAVKRTVDTTPPTEIDNTVYNHWLEALMAVSEPTTDVSFPQVMRTAIWHDRKLETVLASWAEMRHDTILIIEQSTGGVICEYPKGYVEPIPELYQSLAAAAEKLGALYVSEGGLFENTPAFFQHWLETLSTLEQLTYKELAGEPMTEADLVFLKSTVEDHLLGGYGGGDRRFNGWYPALFWAPFCNPLDAPECYNEVSAISEPIVADVHTDAESRQALEVATAHPGLMLVAIDNDGDLSIYGGPVASYYSFHVGLSERMTDDEWVDKIESNDLPERPAFAKGYWSE